MKKLLLAIILLIIPSTSIASYIIKLKSGSEIFVYSYWQEGNKILFHAYGGTVGFPKDSIESIYELSEKSDSPKNVLPEKEIKYEETAEIDESRPTPKDLETKKKVAEDKLNSDDYKNKKISLVKRLKNQQKKLEQDISRGKTEMWIERRKRKIKDIMSEIESIAKELMEKNNGILPDWWNDISVSPPNDSS